MRIAINLMSSTEKLPLDYQKKLVGTFHKWMQRPDLHEEISLYSFSRIIGLKAKGRTLYLGRNPHLYFSAHDENLVINIIKNITNDPQMFNGMSVKDVIIIPESPVENKDTFYLHTPVFIARTLDGQKHKKFYNFWDSEAGDLMTETMQRKLTKAGIDDNVRIEFDRSFINPKLCEMRYDGIVNIGSMCAVKIIGSDIVKKFARDVGIGNSTGIGYGCLI